MTEKTTFTAIVRTQKTNLPGAFGRINSKELAPFIKKKVRVTVEEIEEKKPDESKSPTPHYKCGACANNGRMK